MVVCSRKGRMASVRIVKWRGGMNGCIGTAA